MELPIISGSYSGRSPTFSGRECINWFPNKAPKIEDQKTEMSLYPCSGYGAPWATAPVGGPWQALCAFNGVGYGICNNEFYTISSTGKLTPQGTMAPSPGTQPYIIPGANGWILITYGVTGYTFYIPTQTFAVITDPDFPGADNGFFQDGYFIVTFNGNFYYSSLGFVPFEGTNWDPLWVITPNFKPNTLRAVGSLQEDIYLMCDDRLEIYYNDGVSPFSRRYFSASHLGIDAPNSLVQIENQLIWLGTTEGGQKAVCYANRSQSLAISPESMNWVFSQMAVTNDAFAFGYHENGHPFYQITFPTANVTYVYDLFTQYWHQKQSLCKTININGMPNYGRHTANCHMFLANQHIIGDYQSGNLYKWDAKQFTENGTPLRRRFTTKTFQMDRKQVSAPYFTIDYDAGDAPIGTNPQLVFQTSKDSGRTWGYERWESLGQTGQYKNRLKWNGLGRSRDWTFRFTVTDPCNCILAESSLTASEPGTG